MSHSPPSNFAMQFATQETGPTRVGATPLFCSPLPLGSASSASRTVARDLPSTSGVHLLSISPSCAASNPPSTPKPSSPPAASKLLWWPPASARTPIGEAGTIRCRNLYSNFLFPYNQKPRFPALPSSKENLCDPVFFKRRSRQSSCFSRPASQLPWHAHKMPPTSSPVPSKKSMPEQKPLL